MGSFADGTFSCYSIDLNRVGRRLEWNPHPRDRGEATQELWWDRDTISESVLRNNVEHALEDAKKCAERYARPLARYHGGRIILDAEEPGEHASDYSFWWTRAEYYRLEYEKLNEEDYNRASGSVTPEIANPDMPWNTEVDRAKCEAGNVARMLADFPAGKALLEAEDHGNSTKNGDYWWSLEKFQEPQPEAEYHRDSIMDPDYWRNKRKFYSAQLKAELETTELERAKRSADSRARDLATFPAGKTLLDAEDHGDSLTDPKHWWNKKKYYEAEIDKLKEEFWERWKRTHLDGGETPVESLDCRESPPKALNTARLKTRARKSLALGERRSARVARSKKQQEKEIDRRLLGPTASRAKSYTGFNKAKDARSTERRQSKSKYRHQDTHVVERKPRPTTPACTIAQRPPNGYPTPESDDTRTRPSRTKEWYKASTPQRRYKVPDQLPQNPYVSPSFPDLSTAKARQRRKRKGLVRQKRCLDADSTYRGSTAVSQPISSRLRNSIGFHAKGIV